MASVGTKKISPREWALVRNLIDPDSPTFSNWYRSSIAAGYSPWSAKKISEYISRGRIKEIIEQMNDPKLVSLMKAIQTDNNNRPEGAPVEVRPSKRELKRQKIAQNNRSNMVLNELDAMLGASRG
jgi:hypothetical protein